MSSIKKLPEKKDFDGKTAIMVLDDMETWGGLGEVRFLSTAEIDSTNENGCLSQAEEDFPDAPLISISVSELLRVYFQHQKSLLDSTKKKTDAIKVDLQDTIVKQEVRECLLGESTYEDQISDWRKTECPIELPLDEDNVFNLSIEKLSVNQYDVQILCPSDDEYGLGLNIEVDKGKPCVHLTNTPLGDNVIHVYAEREGLIVQRESKHLSVGIYPDLPDSVLYGNNV